MPSHAMIGSHAEAVQADGQQADREALQEKQAGLFGELAGAGFVGASGAVPADQLMRGARFHGRLEVGRLGQDAEHMLAEGFAAPALADHFSKDRNGAKQMEEGEAQSALAQLFGKGFVDEVVGQIAFHQPGDDIFLQCFVECGAQAVVGNVEQGAAVGAILDLQFVDHRLHIFKHFGMGGDIGFHLGQVAAVELHEGAALEKAVEDQLEVAGAHGQPREQGEAGAEVDGAKAAVFGVGALYSQLALQDQH